MAHVLLVILAVIVGAFVTICPFVWLYWTFHPHERPTNPESKGAYWVFVGALFGFAGFFSSGFYSALFFIPRSWARLNEHGEFVRTRESVSGLLGVLAAFFAVWLLNRVEKLIEENRSLRTEIADMRTKLGSSKTSNQTLQPTAGRSDSEI